MSNFYNIIHYKLFQVKLNIILSMYVIVFQGMDLNPLIEYTCTKRKLFYPNYYLFINRIPNYYLFINGIPIHRISLTATSAFFTEFYIHVHVIEYHLLKQL